jgi:hypothetical protein
MAGTEPADPAAIDIAAPAPDPGDGERHACLQQAFARGGARGGDGCSGMEDAAVIQADRGVRAALGHRPRDPLGVIARDELDLLAALFSQRIQEPTPCATGVPSRSSAPTPFRSGYVNGCCEEEEEEEEEENAAWRSGVPASGRELTER